MDADSDFDEREVIGYDFKKFIQQYFLRLICLTKNTHWDFKYYVISPHFEIVRKAMMNNDSNHFQNGIFNGYQDYSQHFDGMYVNLASIQQVQMSMQFYDCYFDNFSRSGQMCIFNTSNFYNDRFIIIVEEKNKELGNLLIKKLIFLTWEQWINDNFDLKVIKEFRKISPDLMYKRGSRDVSVFINSLRLDQNVNFDSINTIIDMLYILHNQHTDIPTIVNLKKMLNNSWYRISFNEKLKEKFNIYFTELLYKPIKYNSSSESQCEFLSENLQIKNMELFIEIYNLILDNDKQSIKTSCEIKYGDDLDF